MREIKDNILEVEGVFVSYTDQKEKQVLQDISFQIRPGEILGLVGESGCGKSTLSKVILGFLKPEQGKIIHYSEHPQMVFQDPFGSLNPTKTVGWILEEPLKNMTNYNKQERLQKVEEMLHLIGLDASYRKRYPRELSGGQRQRISIGAAFISGAKLIIADEPVSALDVTIQAQIMDLMLELQEQLELSYLFISHDLNVVYQICDRVMVMKDGKIIEIQDTEELFAHPKEAYTKQLLSMMEG